MAVVLITGCSSGFGLETALAFARNGDVVCASMRNLDRSEPLRRRAADEVLDIVLEQIDVTDVASVDAGITAVVRRHGPIDVLVNNAGVGFGGPVETIPLEVARAVMETNFWGAVSTIRGVLPSMRERRTGVIINVTSLGGLIPGVLFTGMYSASKHALGTLSETLATEVAPFGVRIVCIGPGFFATEIAHNNESADNGVAGSAYEDDWAWWHSFGEKGMRVGADPRFVADAIVAAAYDPTTPLHVPVGADAERFVALWDQSRTYEKWMDTAMAAFETTAGPRPKSSPGRSGVPRGR
jgi:NAD(P)-dependent dehydrogenase (short-subunit alcohol dehydrogenase family)